MVKDYAKAKEVPQDENVTGDGRGIRRLVDNVEPSINTSKGRGRECQCARKREATERERGKSDEGGDRERQK